MMILLGCLLMAHTYPHAQASRVKWLVLVSVPGYSAPNTIPTKFVQDNSRGPLHLKMILVEAE